MPHRSNDAPTTTQTRVVRRSATATTPVLAMVAGASMLLLAACGSEPVQAGATGGVVSQADASVAQRSAMDHCRKYGKNGRVTGPLGRESFGFVCE
jgi:hypothetical protein